MKVMGITDPAEFQRVAKDYCKEQMVEMKLPAYMRIFSRINKRIDVKKEAFTSLRKRRDMIAHVLKAAMEDEEIVDIFKTSFEAEDKDSAVSPDLRYGLGMGQEEIEDDVASWRRKYFALFIFVYLARTSETRVTLRSRRRRTGPPWTCIRRPCSPRTW